MKDAMKASSSDALEQQLNQYKHQLSTSTNHITQVCININDATTVHKLQGCSNDKLIVWPWTKKLKHWVYVILSRVQILLGLYFFRTI